MQATTNRRGFMRTSAALALGAALAIPGTALAQTIKWDMAEAFTATSLAGQASGDFARLVKEKSGGRIEVTVHYNGSLGIAEVGERVDAAGLVERFDPDRLPREPTVFSPP